MARPVRITALAPKPILREAFWDHGTTIDHMIAHWDRWLEKVLYDKPDLIVLPECCDRYGNSGPELTEYYHARGSRVRDHFMEIAKSERVNIAYSAYWVMPDGTMRNATQFLNRDGGIDGVYHKNYPAVYEYTGRGVLCGKEASIIQTNFGKVAAAICFDLNFEELRSVYAAQHPELIVFSSAYHGALMQNYWAYSCRSWFVSSIPGEQCTVINPVGTTVAAATNYFPYVTADINLDYKVVHLDENWGKLDAVRKKYGRGVKVFDPGYLGAVLLTSEREDVTTDDMVSEFSIELWDEYYARSVASRFMPGHMEP